MELILYNLSISWTLMAIFFISLFAIGCIIYIGTREFRVKNGKIKAYGLLISIKDRDIFAISIIAVRTFLIIYSLIVYNQNIFLYISMIGIISALLIMYYFRNIIYEIINSLALITIIYFNNQLSNYLISVEKSISVQIIKLILMTFGITYTVYLLLKEFEDITADHENID